MRKRLIAGAMCFVMLGTLSGCIPFRNLQREKTVEVNKEEKEEIEEIEEVEYEEVEETTDSEQEVSEPDTEATGIQYPLGLCHASGVGAWSSDIELQADGTFTGCYYDMDMGSTGEGYPNGTQYTCSFRGKFTDIRRIDPYSFALTLETLTVDEPIGKIYIKDGIQYVCTGAGGLTGADEETPAKNFILYVPGTPLSMLPEDFKIWYDMTWGYGSEGEQTLPIYGLRNLETEDGFFGE